MRVIQKESCGALIMCLSFTSFILNDSILYSLSFRNPLKDLAKPQFLRVVLVLKKIQTV